MKILFIHGERGQGGGAESLLRDQAQGLKRLGHETAWWYGVGSLDDAIAHFKPDICHLLTLHCYPMGLAPAIYLQDQGVPHVWHIQDYWPFCAGRMLMVNGDQSCSAVDGACLNECGERAPLNYLSVVNKSFVVAGNANTAELYKRNGMRCDAVVELGVDTELFAPDPEAQREGVATTCAWPEGRWKGLHVMEQAMKGLPVIGKLITGVSREQVAQELKNTAVFVFPSCYEETFGLVLCEAMASGCACVSTDTAGGGAQIEHGVTGLLIERRNPDAMREAIGRLLDDAGLRGRLGRAAQEHVAKDHSLEAMAERWEMVYEELV